MSHELVKLQQRMGHF